MVARGQVRLVESHVSVTWPAFAVSSALDCYTRTFMPPALARLLPYVLRYWFPVAFGLACALTSTAFQLVGPWVLKHAVDDLAAGVSSSKLSVYAVLIVVVSLVSGVFRFLMRRVLMGASRDMELDIRNDFFRHLQALPLGYYQARRTGDLMSRATNDLSAVRMMIGPAVMYAVTTGFLFVVALGLMLSINVKLTLISLVPLPFVSLAVRYFGVSIHARFERIQAQLSDISAIVQEALAGVRVVRAYRQEAAELERFRQANEEYLQRNRALIALQGLFYPSLTLFLGLAGLLVLWLGSRDVILGRMTLGDFVAFNAYLAMLSWPMIAFGWVINLLQRGLASWKRMLEVLETPPAIADVPGARAPEGWSISGAIEFRNLTFGYDERPVLRGINLSIARGQSVALVGPTGSGKSTLISLLPRLNDPPARTVFIDGVDVREIPLAQLRNAVGMVPQEPFLFSDTVAQNIAFGAPHRDDVEDILEVAAIARLDKDVEAFPRAWETMVGERGLTLSGGQKQRTAIARALLIDPPILILDDAFSAVDTYTEEEILRRLRGVMRERTSIIVSHRISTVREADLIVVLEEGRIAERGAHNELVLAGGPYSELYRKQLLEEELAAS
jgi:ATP-binding cassette, subfamily B, multidrug efflux pump